MLDFRDNLSLSCQLKAMPLYSQGIHFFYSTFSGIVHWKRWYLHFNMKPHKPISSIGISEKITQRNSTYSPEKSGWCQGKKELLVANYLLEDNMLPLKRKSHTFSLEIIH